MKTKAYKGDDGMLYRQLIQPVKITIVRAEGPAHLCGIKQVCETFPQSTGILLSNSSTAPKTGGYNKHDFTVEYEDGYIYEGRYDLQHATVTYPDLAGHMRRFMWYVAFDPRAQTSCTKTDIAEARHFLTTYNVQQPPIRIAPGESFVMDAPSVFSAPLKNPPSM